MIQDKLAGPKSCERLFAASAGFPDGRGAGDPLISLTVMPAEISIKVRQAGNASTSALFVLFIQWRSRHSAATDKLTGSCKNGQAALDSGHGHAFFNGRGDKRVMDIADDLTAGQCNHNFALRASRIHQPLFQSQTFQAFCQAGQIARNGVARGTFTCSIEILLAGLGISRLEIGNVHPASPALLQFSHRFLSVDKGHQFCQLLIRNVETGHAVLRAPIPDPAPVPCKQQSWYNADRACLTWTAPRKDPRAFRLP